MGGETLAIVILEILNAATILVLLALGLAVVFGMMRIVNLAHGEFLTIGAFTTLATVRFVHLPLWIGMVLAAGVAGLLGIAIERLVIRHLYGRPLDAMLATWGVSLVLIGVITMMFGPVTFGLSYALGSFTIGRYQYSEYRLAMSAAAGLMMLIVYLLFYQTRFGRHARATIGNPEVAASLGINTGRMFMLTFALGCALAGAAGAILSPLVGVVPTMGILYIARAFITVIVGGPVALVGTAGAAS
jgi:branched-chain amino acid transport system permease protein